MRLGNRFPFTGAIVEKRRVLDKGYALRESGWPALYSKVVRLETQEDVGGALIDVNGDGQEIEFAAYVFDDGRWSEVGSVGCGSFEMQSPGSGFLGPVAFAYGFETQNVGSLVRVEYSGIRHAVRSDSDGVWLFVHKRTDWNVAMNKMSDPTDGSPMEAVTSNSVTGDVARGSRVDVPRQIK